MNTFDISLSGSSEKREETFRFQTERFLRLCRCAQRSLDLPLLFFNALSLWDAHQGGKSYDLLVQFQSLCRECLRLRDRCSDLFQGLSQFGGCLSVFCQDTAASIKELPMSQQCTEILSPDMRRQIAQMHEQAEYQARSSNSFLAESDCIRIQMDNEIQPYAAVFRQMLDAQPPLVVDTRWEHVEVRHCGFLAKNPAVDGLIRSLRDARTAEEAAKSRVGLHNVAERLWMQVEEALTSVGNLNEDLIQTSADIRSLNTMWASMGQYLDDIVQSLSGAMDSSSLMIVRSHLDSCAGQWKTIAAASQDIVKQLAGAEYNAADKNN